MNIMVIDDVDAKQLIEGFQLRGHDVTTIKLTESDVKTFFSTPPDLVVYVFNKLSPLFCRFMERVKEQRWDIDFLVCSDEKAIGDAATLFCKLKNVRYISEPDCVTILQETDQIVINRRERLAKLSELLENQLHNYLLFQNVDMMEIERYPRFAQRYLVLGLHGQLSKNEKNKFVSHLVNCCAVSQVLSIELRPYTCIVLFVQDIVSHSQIITQISKYAEISVVLESELQINWLGVFSALISVIKSIDQYFYQNTYLPLKKASIEIGHQRFVINPKEQPDLLPELYKIISISGHNKLRNLWIMNLWLKSQKYKNAEKLIMTFEQAKTFDEFIALVPHSNSGLNRKSQVEGEIPEDIESVINFIKLNFTSELSLKQLCEVAHLSKSYLCHSFKRHTGMSCKEYQTHLRMVLAEKLLKESTIRVCEISEMVGYNSYRHFFPYFVNIFKQHQVNYEVMLNNIVRRIEEIKKVINIIIFGIYRILFL